jgi:hypothetical protein
LASAVFRYAVATARLASDPTRDLRGALTAPTVTHYGAITDATKAGQLLRAIDDYDGSGITKLALQIAPHVFVRPGELRHAEWSEIDLDDALWVIPAGKMKMRKTHHVPLSRQAVALFRETQSITGPNGYVFPSVRTRTRPMSENTINAGLRRLGYTSDEMTAHGFRAMASTLLNESGKWNPDAIERALAHGDTDKVRAAYHRGKHWEERVAMAQWWSDHLDHLRTGAEILPFPPARPGEGDSHDHSRQQKFAALLFYRCSWCSGVPSPDSCGFCRNTDFVERCSRVFQMPVLLGPHEVHKVQKNPHLMISQRTTDKKQNRHMQTRLDDLHFDLQRIHHFMHICQPLLPLLLKCATAVSSHETPVRKRTPHAKACPSATGIWRRISACARIPGRTMPATGNSALQKGKNRMTDSS